jgi:hypothetical protein
MIYAKIVWYGARFQNTFEWNKELRGFWTCKPTSDTSRTNANNDNPIMTGDLSPRPAPTYLIDTAPSFSRDLQLKNKADASAFAPGEHILDYM